jgi:tRNA A-37 threonylcarbamoyl transferase component Bud32
MAEIWKARIHGTKNFQRMVVVKRILPHLCLDPELVNMFAAEAMLSAQLNHTNIVQVFEFAENEGELYLAMEYVNGVNLAELLKRLDGVPVPVGMAAYLVREVALALAYAHALKDEEGRPLSIIHRDVSPSNVMVGYDGSVKLVDFGVAMARISPENGRIGNDSLKGKVAYMSPEALDGKLELDGRTDIFAAGVLLHELLTARRLFRAHDDQRTMALVRACKVRPPSRQRADVPADLDGIVARALARDRRSRYASADTFAAELARVAARCAWDRVQTAAFLREHGIQPSSEPAADAGTGDATLRAMPGSETKRITVVERRLRSGGSLPTGSGKRRLRWALTGAAAALALSGALALGVRLSRGQFGNRHNGDGDQGGDHVPLRPHGSRVGPADRQPWPSEPYMMTPEVNRSWAITSRSSPRSFSPPSVRTAPTSSTPPRPAGWTAAPSGSSS